MTGHDDGLPNDPEGIRLMIHALVDGELDAAAALAVERRIAADPALAAEHARIVALQAAVSRLPRPDVSDAFRARIAAIGMAGIEQQAPAESAEPQRGASPALPRLIAGAGGGQRRETGTRPFQTRPSSKTRLFGSFDWRALAASIVISAVLASGATQWLMFNGASDSFAAAVASGHRRSLLAASPIDIVSSDRHTVKPWLDARIGVSPPAPDLAQDGYALIGGRVEVIADRPVPALVYRHREHLITLVAEPQQGGSVSQPEDLSSGGFSLVHWSDGAFSYWAISDMERPELDDFVARFRKAAV
ncbi:anti-sigma factor [Mesorhizobium sp. M4B.F.Ca.ET.215.01.1.1]|uniref:anti-sigma factor family protein n=1 Tax=unclassified Mesorhizobium TaxID=325217 RepID=UPI000FCC1C44|nr:anti-sigma factor [Mesorhizobium sp. M4B.F.Ca.ET.019.03.1.1]TGQ07125.1 anti-sigma factor [Mesorhizobium sp. M4B.F.Ca.ET.215.01.1.1]TGQ29681.1 anti-sigma factor [Mesorhizobium sp. M4B.F.Ca.ET.214.01.1.1]TGQ34804.1 anti-sigma factor [Mesorhizobium sp. M00.F.Ca.ET.220.01.1.1]TGQ56514.1 anti-sigma factor [Mesorhizobium sp. M4B.F.Ca.ET.211.01.1.1]TGR00118.1 anti-sigma factor [Mesorhizobium sp. M4B.F.Ca.ET.203.01.1.1]TGR03234.1 anti-sigma factor [Mesorhizobium sp. M4B.F.Ca.ET.200.01.1.1]TGS1460